jgi:hypothetical protein
MRNSLVLGPAVSFDHVRGIRLRTSHVPVPDLTWTFKHQQYGANQDKTETRDQSMIYVEAMITRTGPKP